MTTDRIENILNAVYQRVQALVPADRFYATLYDPQKEELSFPFVAGQGPGIQKDLIRGTKRPYDPERRLPDYLICHAEDLLLPKNVLTQLGELDVKYWPGNKHPASWLGVPLKISDKVIGALVVESWEPSHLYRENDQSLLTTIARQAAIAISNAQLYDDLERKINNLRILNESAQKLTRGLVKQENEILKLLYRGATDLQMDAGNMYIAFYEPDPDRPNTADKVYGMLRFALVYQDGKQVSLPDRPAADGLAGIVIRTKESFNPVDVQDAHKSLARPHKRRIPRSWLGVPMLSEGQVFGVIVLRDYEDEESYTKDDQEILEILAGQAAVALQNLSLFQAQQREQEMKKATESIGLMNMMGADFAHKVNNLAGTIPVRIGMVRELLASTDSDKEKKILGQLTKIEKETEDLLNAAQAIRENNERTPDEEVDINDLLGIAIARAENNENRQNVVKVVQRLADQLPKILVPRNAFLDTLTNIIKNGFEAIDKTGSVTIETHRVKLHGQDTIEIKVIDTGRGIPPSNLSKIFDPFFSTKGEAGLGFGLWRDKIIITRLGGGIDVQSKENQGSTFTIHIPTTDSAKYRESS